MSLNRVMLVGRLAADPESRDTKNGGSIVSMRIATSERWRDKASGEMRDQTEWHNIVILNDMLGEIATKYLHKGSQVYIEGKIQTRKWQDKEGHDRYSTEVVLGRFDSKLINLDPRGAGDSNDGTGSGKRSAGNRSTGWGNDSKSGASSDDDLTDEIPF